jgi:hypothetical protein
LTGDFFDFLPYLTRPVTDHGTASAQLGAGTVATYSITADLFEKSAVGRVNGAINLFHIGGAFLLQTGIGFIIGRWPQTAGGHYPPSAYTAALLFLTLAQALALSWYLTPQLYFNALSGRGTHETRPGRSVSA